MENIINKSAVKDYWEQNTPQYWYSNKERFSKAYYDDIQYKRYNYYYDYLLSYLEFGDHKGENILEIGCGQGTDLLKFAKNGAKVWGIDLTNNAIEQSKRMFSAYGFEGNFKVDDAENLNFKSDFFDLVYSIGVLHHTPNTEKAIKEVYRVLKPGSKAIIMLYSKGLWRWQIILRYYIFGLEFLKNSLQTTINKHTEYKGNSPLTKMYSKRQARKLFKDFNKVKIYKLHLGPRFRKILPWSLYGVIEKILGNNLVIKAIK